MSFLKTLFFMLPLAAVGAVAVAYFLVTQWVQPQVDEVLNQLKASTTAIEATVQSDKTLTEQIKTLTETVEKLKVTP